MAAPDLAQPARTGLDEAPDTAGAAAVKVSTSVAAATPTKAAAKEDTDLSSDLSAALIRHRPSVVKSPDNVPLSRIRFGVSLRDLIIFTRQLATMLSSGLPLHRSLEALMRQTSNPLFQTQLELVSKLLAGGTNFSSALRRFPRTFSPLYVSLIDAAERSGSMDTTLLRLAEYLEKSAQLRKQLRTAITYPVTVGIVAIVVIALMLFKVVPTFERMFASAGTSLPPETQAVLDFSRYLQTNILFLLVGIGMVVGGLSHWYRSPQGRRTLDRYLLRLPWVGDLIIKVAMARFCRTLSTLTSAGIPILDAMDSCMKLTANQLIEQGIRNARASIVSGNTLADGMKQSSVFPPVMYTMLGVGESSGELETMLVKVAEYYDDEVEASVSRMVAMIEPALMLFLGVIVGGLLIAMYLPVFTMSSMVGQGP